MMNIFGLCIPLIRCYILLIYIIHLTNIIIAFKISMINVGCMNIQCSQFPEPLGLCWQEVGWHFHHWCSFPLPSVKVFFWHRPLCKPNVHTDFFFLLLNILSFLHLHFFLMRSLPPKTAGICRAVSSHNFCRHEYAKLSPQAILKIISSVNFICNDLRLRWILLARAISSPRAHKSSLCNTKCQFPSCNYYTYGIYGTKSVTD